MMQTRELEAHLYSLPIARIDTAGGEGSEVPPHEVVE
ncbi:MAG: hypothetical protein JWN34_3937 [Bryobacterales bacterium]|nr:hypothetical protein [Bryobacterales bacterium]